MKKSKLLLSVLVISISVNVFFLTTGFEPQSPCPDIASYTNPAELTASRAQESIDYYSASAGENAITGGVITGQAFKQAFCAPGTNAISYYLAQDPNSEIAGGGVFIVIAGVKVTADASGITSLEETGNKLFVANSWCPTNCVVLKQE